MLIKKIIALILAVLIPVSVPASLNFDLGAIDSINLGSPAALDDHMTGTIAAWVRPESLGDIDGIWATRPNAATVVTGLQLTGTSGAFKFIFRRATTNLLALSSTTPLSVDKWFFVACTWDTLIVAAIDPKLYVGDLTTPIAEVGGYTTQQIGTGAAVAYGGSEPGIGNINAPAAALAWDGDISRVMMWSTVKSLAFLQSIQYSFPVANQGTDLVGMWGLGWNGTTNVPDYSGNGITGALANTPVLGEEVPILNTW